MTLGGIFVWAKALAGGEPTGKPSPRRRPIKKQRRVNSESPTGPRHDKCGIKRLIITSLTAGFAAAAQAEDLDIGKSEFQSSCASCHGTDAKGKGPASDQLKIPPPDLTMLAKNNNGVFPMNAVYETIMD
jgi:mono/diheme cytochrome c family protein